MDEPLDEFVRLYDFLTGNQIICSNGKNLKDRYWLQHFQTVNETNTRNNLKYLFLIGPFIKTPEDKYYLELIEFFNINEIKFERKHYIFDNNNIGDTIYHVHPKFKSESTAYYKNLIHNYFKKNNSY